MKPPPPLPETPLGDYVECKLNGGRGGWPDVNSLRLFKDLAPTSAASGCNGETPGGSLLFLAAVGAQESIGPIRHNLGSATGWRYTPTHPKTCAKR